MRKDDKHEKTESILTSVAGQYWLEFQQFDYFQHIEISKLPVLEIVLETESGNYH